MGGISQDPEVVAAFEPVFGDVDFHRYEVPSHVRVSILEFSHLPVSVAVDDARTQGLGASIVPRGLHDETLANFTKSHDYHLTPVLGVETRCHREHAFGTSFVDVDESHPETLSVVFSACSALEWAEKPL